MKRNIKLEKLMNASLEFGEEVEYVCFHKNSIVVGFGGFDVKIYTNIGFDNGKGKMIRAYADFEERGVKGFEIALMIGKVVESVRCTEREIMVALDGGFAVISISGEGESCEVHGDDFGVFIL